MTRGKTYAFKHANLDVWMRVEAMHSGTYWVTWSSRFSPNDRRLWNPDTFSSSRVNPDNWQET